MLIFPVLSIILLLASMFISIKNKKDKTIIPLQLSLTLNGVLLFTLIGFVSYFVEDEQIITLIPSSLYWFLIVAGLMIMLFSFNTKSDSGHLTSASILLFTGFIAIFSIGIVLIALAILELGTVYYRYKNLTTTFPRK